MRSHALRVPAPVRRGVLAVAALGALILLLAPGTARAQTTTTETTLPAALEASVKAQAATAASVTAAETEVLRVEAVTWNDGCIGLPATSEACTQALVDGYVAWVLAGGNVYRFHTDESTGIRQAEGTIQASAVASASLPDGATAREIPIATVIEGDIPTQGVVMFRITAGASVEQIQAELSGRGCEAATIAKTVGGKWYIYGYESPVFANAGFFAADASVTGGVQASTILITNCLPASSN